MTEHEQERHLEQTRARARELMSSLGRQELGEPLQARGWTFGFDRARRRLGACRWKKRQGRVVEKRITLSRPFVALHGLAFRDEDGLAVVEDVIRHEIAHAIAWEQSGEHGHGPGWKAVCRRVGADPSRLYEGGGLRRVPGRWVGRCPACGVEVEYHRRPKHPRACSACCARHAGGRYDDRFRLALTDRRTGAPAAYGAEEPARPFKYVATCPACGYRTGFRRRPTRTYACPPCCRTHAGGRYDDRYRLELVQQY